MNAAAVSISEPLAPGRDWWLTRLSWLCALSPWVMLVLYITVGVHLRLGLGYWPAPVLEDYHAPAFGIHQRIVGCFILFAVFGAGPLWVLCLLLRPLCSGWRRTVIAQLSVCALGWLLIFSILHFKLDPTPFTVWFLD